jgi:NitT/TauT family transport system substrate-binding protein
MVTGKRNASHQGVSMSQKQCVLSIIVASLILAAGWTAQAAEPPLQLVVSVPGPRSLSYLPIDLISKIGADQAEGAKVTVRYLSGGGVVYKELMSRNTDFGAAGTPAAMSLKINGGSVVAIAPLSSDVPVFILMVRADLKNKVKTIADLKGRVIGIYTSSLSSKTVSQQLAEMVLKAYGVSPELVRYVSAEHSYDSLATLFKSRTVDAVMGSEPFASRLLAEKKVFFLMNLADREAAEKIPGAGFLHAVVATREEVIEREPKKVEAMVKIIKRTLQWVSKATPEQIVDVDIQIRREALAASDLEKIPEHVQSGWPIFQTADPGDRAVFQRFFAGIITAPLPGGPG